jgi:hypothetical protein
MATIAQVAVHIDVSERHCKTLIDEGVFKRAPSGRHDLDDCRVRYIRHLRDAAKGRSDSSSGLTDARTRVANARAEIVEQEVAVAKGEWVLLDDVGEFYMGQLMVAREILLTMIGQIGNALGLEAEDIAERATYDAMNEMADPYSDKQREVHRAGLMIGKKYDEKEWDEEKKEYEEKQAAEKRKAEKAHQRIASGLPRTLSKSNEVAVCACPQSATATCPRDYCPRKRKANA